MKTVIVLFVLLLTGCAAEPANQRNLLTQFVGNNAPVDPEPSPVLVNIRNVLTGGIIRNPVGSDFNVNNWVISEVKTNDLDLISAPGGHVQIKNPDGNECLAILNGQLAVAKQCSESDRNALFTFITSDTGAVQIKSIGSGQCLGNGESITDFRLKKCVDDLGRPFDTVPPGLLWMLNPPLSPAIMSPLTS
ncbi:TPA: cytolethal distending toxin type I subunit CdtC [Escherichia coli]|uniref:Cytolethal distending toxin C n=1 Tax=Escherichia coli TaxID=562 RepID=C4TIT5_ECOLX|nr:cytolethal distending toxin C [Escherichia coli]HAI6731091.1 cytolethal distending toxin type I subunit CdtC [Escherichia coli]HDT2169879.1 cytolethal distending toxin type I subunit CdtC [Escherichia coli]